MSLETQQFKRKDFFIEAVRVDPENIDQVAKWCKGEITSSTNPTTGAVDDIYIQVDVKRPQNERQTRAYFGDWVLKAGTGFKVYRHKAFWKDFERVEHRNVFDGNLGGPLPADPFDWQSKDGNKTISGTVNIFSHGDAEDVDEPPTPVSRTEHEERAPLVTDKEVQEFEEGLNRHE